MVHKALNFVLLVAIVVGGFLAWRTGEERSRLTRRTGGWRRSPAISRSTTRRRCTSWPWIPGRTLHFAWRIYLPPNYTQIIKHNAGGPTLLVGDRRGPDDRPGADSRERPGPARNLHPVSGRQQPMSFGDKALADLLRDRWDEVRVEQLGADGVADGRARSNRPCCSA